MIPTMIEPIEIIGQKTSERILNVIRSSILKILYNSDPKSTLVNMQYHLRAHEIASGINYEFSTWETAKILLEEGKFPNALIYGDSICNNFERLEWQGSRRKTKYRAKCLLGMKNTTLTIYHDNLSLELKFMVR